ncbi:cysteine hydrolase family protein [Polynucleobacter kasalickyi]|uniref:Ureidoacrylate peracid hydrolase n=1 Tax=Polynucleobacter kasalickyi TaxID=1938817 RepID=A0A1W1Z5T5_9BURK|nr:cysteine hydrolase [Polynucleobacter kasalickyi]SMC43820.1 ureidoacrylate peracid hydrolase [Polynucleobacter kasalickyi]
MINIGVDRIRAAVIGIDLHRGHLDMSVATMPASPEIASAVVEKNIALMNWARTSSIPVIHLVTRYRDSKEISMNAFWRTRAADPNNPRKNVMRHNLIGMPGCEIMPGIYDPAKDFVVDTKKRYNCFVATDLEFLLKTHDINTLIITGVNTNSCVLSTVTAACSMDYAVIVPSDCVNTMDHPSLHDAALLCIKTAFGFVMSSEEVMQLPELQNV